MGNGGIEQALPSGGYRPWIGIARLVSCPFLWIQEDSAPSQDCRFEKGRLSIAFKRTATPLPFGKNASAVTPSGTCCPQNAPLMAITRTIGNWRRMRGSNSEPDMPGMLRSDSRISGTSSLISTRAAKPSAAHRTRCPSILRISAREVRTNSSSSTIKMEAL